MATAHINRIGVATPPHDIQKAFLRVAEDQIASPRERALFRRMTARAGIDHRYSVLADAIGLYPAGAFPGTAARMALYEEHAPELALAAIGALGIETSEITHLVVASCTGFMAPGLDQVIAARAGLRPSVERTLVGFMGCYAAVNSLRLAHHIVRSEPDARVLVVCTELCTLHFQETGNLEKLLSALLFGDGAAAALVTAQPQGLALTDFRSAALPGSAELITWRIGDSGFDMHLSGDVPKHIGAALRDGAESLLGGDAPIDLFAVHAGGRTILDAVESGLELGPDALRWSRSVLSDFGNMSSATLMFVLARILADPQATGHGLAMAFGPGLAAESFRFEKA